MNIRPFTSGLVGTDSYVLTEEGSSDCILIDCPDGIGRALSFIKEEGLCLKYILLTHGHFDHVLGLPEARREFPNVEIWMSEKDWYLIKNGSEGNKEIVGANFSPILEMYGEEFDSMPTDVHFYSEKDNSILGFEVIETPGHTPGSVCLFNRKENVLFSGDTIFHNGYGRTDFPHGSGQDLLRSIMKVLKSIPADTRICPGHGEGTSAGEERYFNRI